MMKNHTNKSKAAFVSIVSNTVLILLKIAASLYTGSISILSEAFHSLSDLIASIITWFSVKYSDLPPDERHPYGHGKIENVTASIEAILVLIAAIYILYEAITRLFLPKEISFPLAGAVIMFISFLTNLFVSRYLYKVSKKTASLALEGDALHLRADMFASITIVIGFVFIYFFQWFLIDTLLALLVAIYMIVEGTMLLRKSFNPLMDEAANIAEITQIKEYFSANQYVIHDLKTRKSGNRLFVDVHLELSLSMTLKEVHDICDIIEKELKEKNKFIEINIHVEPFQ